MPDYFSPAQAASAAHQEFARLTAQQAPTAPPGPITHHDTFETQKQNWLLEARKLNPDVNPDTISKMYDQKVAPALSEGRDPSATSDTHAANLAIQNQTKQSLIPPENGMGSNFVSGVMRGLKDVGQGILQADVMIGEKYPILQKLKPGILPLAPYLALIPPQEKGATAAYTAQTNKEIADYEKQTENHPIASGAGRLIGNVLATLPAGEVGGLENIISRPLVSRLAGGAIQGGLVGGLIFDPTGEHKASRALVGSLIGAVIPGGVTGAKSIFKWLVGKPTLIDDPLVLEEAANRVKDAKELGISGLTAGAATREPVIQTLETKMLKQGATRAAQMFKDAHEQISNEIHGVGQKMVDAIGGKPLTNIILGEDIKTALESTKKLARERVSKMYKAAEEAPGADQELYRRSLLDKIDEIKDDFTDLKLSPGINKLLTKINKKNEQGMFVNPFTVKGANQLIASVNRAYRATTMIDTRAALNIIRSNTMDAIDPIADNDNNPSRMLFNLARQIRKRLADVYDQKDIVNMLIRKKSRTTNYINPEQVANRIFGGDENLTNLNKIEGALKYEVPMNQWMKEAKRLNPKVDLSALEEIYNNQVIPQQKVNLELWDNLRASKLNQVMQDSTSYINGQPQLSYTKLVKNVKQIGQPALTKILGSEELATKFNKLISVMDAWEKKAPSIQNQDGTIKAIQKASSGIFAMIGDPETRLGGYLHFPFQLIQSIMRNVNDERWVRANLLLGSKDTSPLMDIAKEDPSLVHNVINTLQHHNLLKQHVEGAITRGAVAGALPPQVPTATPAALTGEQ